MKEAIFEECPEFNMNRGYDLPEDSQTIFSEFKTEVGPVVNVDINIVPNALYQGAVQVIASTNDVYNIGDAKYAFPDRIDRLDLTDLTEGDVFTLEFEGLTCTCTCRQLTSKYSWTGTFEDTLEKVVRG